MTIVGQGINSDNKRKMFSSAIKIVVGSIFPLFSINRKKIRVLGTCFFIDNKGHFITAKHVIDAIESGSHLGYLGNVPREKFHKKKPRQVKIIFSDPEKDLAIGKTDQEPLPGLAIADSEPDLGASICLCGYPLPSVTETSGQHTNSFDV